MINLSMVLRSPHFRQTFKVYRTTGYFDLGGWVESETSPAYTEVQGAVWPSSEKEIRQVPEGDRTTGMVTFVSEEPFYLTRVTDSEEATSDQIEWKSERYKLVSKMDYSDYGFYAVVGVRMVGA